MDPLVGIRYGSQIEQAARAHGLDPRLLAAVAAQETGGPGADSGRNVIGDGGHGRGLFQIDDRFHAFARSAQAMDPGQNADYAAGMLHGLLELYGGNVRAALSAYNAGDPNATGTVTTWADGRTLGYADSVLQHEAALGGLAATPVVADAAQAPAGFAPVVPPPITGAPVPVGGGLVMPPLTLPQATLPPWSPVTYTSEAGPGTSIGTTMGAANDLMAGLVDPSDGTSQSGTTDGLG